MSEAERMLPAEPLRRFKPYPAYKDSGIEWLREVPAHWEESKVKFLGTYVNGYPFKPEDWSAEGLPIIRIQNLTDLNASFNRFAGNVDLRYRVRKGDILISWSASLGLFVWTRDEDAWLNQHIFKVQLSESRITRDFFVWLGTWFIRELQKETHGSTMTHLTWGRFGGFRVEIPSDPEQRAIAAFLDRETARIDALVGKKERLIALLHEKRTALITRAVTKGLDPAVPMKDSGVEWLGEIPAHWRSLALKRIGELQAGAGFPDGEQGILEEELPFFKVGDMGAVGNGREMRVHQHTVSRETARRLGAFVFPASTVVFAKVGAALLLNRRRLLVRPSCIDNNMMGFIPDDCDPTWALYWLSGLDMGELANPGAVPSVNEGQMHDTPAAVPPPSEQRVIAAFLDREMAQLDALIAKVRDGIDRLDELRTALVSAAVTGKIDVRGEAA